MISAEIYLLLLDKTLRWAVWDEYRTARNSTPKKEIIVFTKDPERLLERCLDVGTDRFGEPTPQDLNWFYDHVTSIKFGVIKTRDKFEKDLKNFLLNIPFMQDSFPDELEKIRQVFVPPKGYAEFIKQIKQQKILAITGPPHIGKTATAYGTLIHLLKTNQVKEVSVIKKPDEIARKLEATDCGILIDDAFSNEWYEYFFHSCGVNNIVSLSKRNFIILTGREDLYQKVFRETYWAETRESFGTPFQMAVEQSYSPDSLRDILCNHLSYWRQKESISLKQYRLAENYRDQIVSQLVFPHNIEVFVRAFLPNVQSEDQLQSAIQSSKNIEKAVQRFFTNKGKDVKIFLFCLYCFHGLPIEDIEKAFLIMLESSRLPKSDFKVCKDAVSTYICSSIIPAYGGNSITLEFRHDSYKNGIFNGICDEFSSIGPLMLKDLIFRFNGEFRWRAVRVLATIRSAKAANVIQELMTSEDEDVCASAILAAGLGKFETTWMKLVQLLSDPRHKVAKEAAIALGLIREKGSVPDLLVILSSGEHPAPWRIIDALAEIGDPRSLLLLKTFQNGNDPYISWRASEAINKITHSKKIVSHKEKRISQQTWTIDQIRVLPAIPSQLVGIKRILSLRGLHCEHVLESLNDFVTATWGTTVVGCGCLSATGSGYKELRSLASLPGWEGVERLIGKFLTTKAIKLGEKQIWGRVGASTKWEKELYEFLGFVAVDKNILEKVWPIECGQCPSLGTQGCKEIPSVKYLQNESPSLRSE